MSNSPIEEVEVPNTKIELSDGIRSRIRWSDSKVGYLVKLHHACGPRGGRVRPTFFFAGTVEAAANREAESALNARWSHPVIDVDIIKVTALGEVIA